MTALAFAPGRGWEDAGRGGPGASRPADDARPAQPRLFALPGGAALTEPEPPASPALPAPLRTLDAALTGAWSTLALGATAECPLCTGTITPRWSARGEAVGGRCTSCGTTLE